MILVDKYDPPQVHFIGGKAKAGAVTYAAVIILGLSAGSLSTRTSYCFYLLLVAIAYIAYLAVSRCMKGMIDSVELRSIRAFSIASTLGTVIVIAFRLLPLDAGHVSQLREAVSAWCSTMLVISSPGPVFPWRRFNLALPRVILTVIALAAVALAVWSSLWFVLLAGWFSLAALRESTDKTIMTATFWAPSLILQLVWFSAIWFSHR